MGVAIGGRHTVTRVTTTPTRRHTVALTMATVITTARLITTTTREPMAGMGVRMVRTGLRVGVLVIILTPARTLEAALSRLLMEPGAQHKRIIHTPAPMRRRDKVQVPQPNGAVRMCREETRALPRVITRPLMERWPGLQPRRAVKTWGRILHGEIRQPGKLPAATCMPNTMAMFTRIPETAGRSTVTGAGIL